MTRRNLPSRSERLLVFHVREVAMRRSAAAAALLAGVLVLAASALASGVHRSSPTKLSVWAYWSPGTHELTSFNKLVAEYQKNHPEVKISVVGGVDDNKIVVSIRSGMVPEVGIWSDPYTVAHYCRPGRVIARARSM